MNNPDSGNKDKVGKPDSSEYGKNLVREGLIKRLEATTGKLGKIIKPFVEIAGETPETEINVLRKDRYNMDLEALAIMKQAIEEYEKILTRLMFYDKEKARSSYAAW
ncbi:hypothetical protein KJ835_03965, partial [Patescibacteria group bacterium]|nr:hypothetical protein [Patescibacteria group bacterium]